jgi:hypothetical protein
LETEQQDVSLLILWYQLSARRSSIKKTVDGTRQVRSEKKYFLALIGLTVCRLLNFGAQAYHLGMQLVTGTVIEGKVVLTGVTLPEGAVVTVLAQDFEPSVRLPAHLQAELEQALDEADSEEGITAEEMFAELRGLRPSG